jgi:hypothetical protein
MSETRERVPVAKTVNQQIAEFLGVTEEVGARVRDQIDELGLLDWSECTDREFKAACREALADIAG